MKKRLFGLLTALVMIVTCASIPPVAQAEESPVSMSINEEALTVIKSLTNLDEKIIAAEQITRGEFVTALTSLIVINGGEFETQGTVFSDIPTGHSAAAAVNALYHMGYVSGSDGKFCPDNPITYHQAYKLLVSVLGYDSVANYKGGYPGGYLKVASETGITKNITVSSEFVSGKNLVLMLYQTITADMMQLNSIGEDSTYRVVSGENILSKYHKIYTVKGIITATTTLVLNQAEKKTFDDIIEINKIVYYVTNTEADKYLGYNVKAYYKETDDKNTIVCVVPVKNSVVQIDADNVRNFNVSEKKLYCMTDEGKENSYHFSKSFDFVYNGKPNLDYTADSFLIENGSITIIDNNGDGYYDVALVNETKFIYVSSVTADGKIFDKNNEGFLNLSDSTVKFQIYVQKDDEVTPAGFTDIKVGQLLEVSSSVDQKLHKIMITGETVSGTVTEVIDDEIVIDEKAYKISAYFQKYYKSLNAIGQLVGSEGNFLVSGGRIVVPVGRSSVMQYGFVLGINGGKGLTTTTQLKILMENGEKKIFELADKLLLDGMSITNSYTENSLLYKVFNRTYTYKNTSGGDVTVKTLRYRLIRYKVVDEKINVIDTENSSYLGTEPIAEYGFLPDNTDDKNMLRAYSESGVNKRYINNSRQFGDAFRISEAAPIFMVPATLENTDKEYRYEDKDFEIVSIAGLRNNYLLTMKGYNVNQAGAANAVVYYDTNKSADYYSSVAVIESVVNAIDSNSDVTKKIYYWNMDGRFYTALLDKDMYEKSLTEPISAGDVIYYNLKNDMITSYGHYLKYSNVFPDGSYKPSGFTPTNSDGTEITALMGIVYAKDGSTINLIDKGGANRIVGLDRGRIIIFDCKTKQIRHATYSDVVAQTSGGIGDASVIFVKRNTYYNAHVTVIYKTVGGNAD